LYIVHELEVSLVAWRDLVHPFTFPDFFVVVIFEKPARFVWSNSEEDVCSWEPAPALKEEEQALEEEDLALEEE